MTVVARETRTVTIQWTEDECAKAYVIGVYSISSGRLREINRMQGRVRTAFTSHKDSFSDPPVMLRSQVFDGADLADVTANNPPPHPSFMDDGEESGMGESEEEEGSSEGSGGSARKKRRSLPDSTGVDGEMRAHGAVHISSS